MESGVPWSQGLDLSLLLPVNGLIFIVVSKLLLLYSTIDKTSTLKMKSFSTVRVTQRGSQRYMEKRREEGVIGLIFTVVSKLLLLYSTIDKTSTLKMKSFSTVRVTQRGSQHYMEKRRGRRELEVTQMR